MTAISVAKYKEAEGFLSAWRRPLLVSHTKPDGDALGSLAAMRAMLRRRGIVSTALLFDELPHRYSTFDLADQFAVLEKDIQRRDLDSFDGIVILDTCAYSQLEPIADWLRARQVPKLAVDHHRTRDHLADQYLIDETAAANCLILYDWIQAEDSGGALADEIAEALFVGIATDTGWFRHSNTDPRALFAAAALVERGVDAHGLFERLYLRDTEARVRLLGAALRSMELHAGGTLSVMTLADDAFAASGASRADTEDIVNEPLRIESVRVSVLIVEQEDDFVRVSFRSRTPADGVPDIDVAAMAQTFGGGGHERAAGARLAGPLATAKAQVVRRLAMQIDGRTH